MSDKISPLAPDTLGELFSVPGIKLATVATEMKYKGRDDVMLMVADTPAIIAGSLTTSKTCSAAVDWCREVLTNKTGKAILVNAGNANAFTGKRGLESVDRCAKAAGDALGVNADQILLASTGVIGEPMDDQLITRRLDELIDQLDETSWHEAAKAIMTTDTFAKATSRRVEINGALITITGIAKGSGMIAPDMATMLSFIGTDVQIKSEDLKKITKQVVDESFNGVTVDGDTSTSDTVIVMASGCTGDVLDQSGLQLFKESLKDVMVELATQIVKDGEGASKFVTIDIVGAEDNDAARRVGLAIANSPLVKSAIAGEDANWGRIVMAVGKSGCGIDQQAIGITIGGFPVAANGMRVADYDEAPIATHMQTSSIDIAVSVGAGAGIATVYSCDLTHGYITINADYRS